MRSPLTVALLSLLAAGLIYGVGFSQFLSGLELRASDQLFRARYALFGAQPIDERLLMVGIDEPAFEAVGLPTLLWQPAYAQLFERLQGAGAVCLDLVFNPITSRLEGPLLEQLQTEELELGAVVAGGPFLLIELLRDHGETRGPSEILAALARRPDTGRGTNLVVANIVQDDDGLCRRIAAYADDEGHFRSVYCRMIELGTGQTFARAAGGELKLGSVVVPTETGLALRLNYPGPVPVGHFSAFPYVSMKDVLEGKVTAQELQGKLCVVAPAAAILQDYTATPYSSQALGAETHLSALNTVLTGRYIRPVPLPFVLLALLAVVTGQLGLRLVPRRALMAVLAVVAVYWATAVFAFSLAGVWLPLVGGTLAATLGGSVGYTERLLTVERDRAQIRSTFGHMVSPQVMEHVLNSPEVLASGQEREITVLFTDINDFTPVCERHTPPEIIAMLSDYFQLMVGCIMRHDGYVKQFVGDEIMVIFGAPNEQADHAARAVRCGVEILEVLAAAEAKAGGAEGFFDTKIGINTGPVVVGKVGSKDRWEYAAVGDDVNLGARVMGLTKKLEAKMLVSDNTRRAVGDGLPDYEWVSRGVQSFKGKAQQLEIYEVRRTP